jgi:hypothetical protein
LKKGLEETEEQILFSCNICYDVRAPGEGGDPIGCCRSSALPPTPCPFAQSPPDMPNVLLQLASEPVVTLCGHLYCWPCLYRWLQVQSHCRTCPVCKAGVEKDKVRRARVHGGGSSSRRAAPFGSSRAHTSLA